jgi:hypothetical protein
MRTFKMFVEERCASGEIVEVLEDANNVDNWGLLEEETDADVDNWHKAHPVHHKNIVQHWHQATPDEHTNGKDWYKHASHYTGVLAKDSGISKTQMAGLTANYSPQTDWHTNMLHAARVAKYGKGIGGKDQPSFDGRKMMASDHQRKAADSILAGKHYNDVLKGQKIRHFAHLVEHGDDGPDMGKKPHVVVDRHAYSVAAGGRLTDKAFQKAGLGGVKKYNQVGDAYVKAAHHINKHANTPKGHPDHIHPHQVQAVTWLVRQRLNNEEDRERARARAAHEKHSQLSQSSGKEKSRANSHTRWLKYAGEHHPAFA